MPIPRGVNEPPRKQLVFAGTGVVRDDENATLAETRDQPAAQEALAKSFGTFQWTAFYYAVQMDLTGWDPRTV